MTSTTDQIPAGRLSRIARVRLPNKPSSTLWDVSIADGRISSIDLHVPQSPPSHTGPGTLDGSRRLLAPSLCHAHIHLDKCFLLQDPKFGHLQIEKGDFDEAMELTAKAKSLFDEDDLLRRGRQLIEESVRHGVTAMRAFVEVDAGVRFKCLDAGLKLKKEYAERCEVQICAFAQLPLFTGEDGGEENRILMSAAALKEGVDVVGSTPYVEQDRETSKTNIRWISMLAKTHAKHLDLHLDYFLDQDKEPLVLDAVDAVRGDEWERKSRRITLGHCTRLVKFKDGEWRHLKQAIGNLPVAFVGLPTSDLFMMRSEDMVRGTLPVLQMIEQFGLDAALGVNNIGNAFTPYGSSDPLSIATLGVGLYQAGTNKDTDLLYQAVSSRAKEAIGCESSTLALTAGEPADFVLFDSMDAGWRCRKSIAEVVYDAGPSRQTIRRGRVTAF